ncbi:MAG TPA: methylated-DNA--[protein]-cysteine S-methyltransferase [Methylomirabilota bacterium]|nr:methylated-DNA--[protein]-cysteine S-methyltransferase [Methylomirabilota bacterium]
MTPIGFALFETEVGRCGIAWSAGGIAGVQLPESSDAATHARMLRRFPGVRETTPPAEVQRAIDAMIALLRGEPSELESVALDLDDVPPFERSVYEVARTIPPGTTLSYGEIAQRLGAPGAARDVGQALGRNPFPIVVPCHRVVAAGGKLGGFSARGGAATKRRLLSVERAKGHGALPLFAVRPPAAGDRSRR